MVIGQLEGTNYSSAMQNGRHCLHGRCWVLVEALPLQCPKGFVTKPAMLVGDGTIVSNGDGAVVAMSQKLCAEASDTCRGGTMVGDGKGAEVAMP